MTNRSLDFWEGRYRAAEGALWGEEPNGWVAEQAAGMPPGRALDLGAGDGRNALRLAADGWAVTAVDFAPAAIEALNGAAAGRGLAIGTEVADATAWSTAQRFDLAVLCYLQLPAEALAAAIGRAADALAPGGVLLGIWHDRLDVERGLGGTMTPAIRTTPEETAAAARAAGLEVALSTRRDRPTAAGAAADCLLIARRTP